MNNNSNVILVESASSALTTTKNLELVKPSYGFVNTANIVKQFEANGWMLNTANQARARKPKNQGYQKHVLRFRNKKFPTIEGLSNDNTSIPELVVCNSHDGKSALHIFFGVYRMICANGMVAGSTFDSLRVIHSEKSIKDLDLAIVAMTNKVPELIKRVSEYSKKTLTDAAKVELAKKAFEIRLKNTKNIKQVDVDGALRSFRAQDNSDDAFTVFNRLQEKCIRGGLPYVQELANNELRFTKSRAIRSVSENTRINRDLWNEFVKLAG